MRGKALHNEAGEIILRVLAYFEAEKENKGVLYPVDQVIKKTCAATGISPRSLLILKKRAREHKESMASLSAQGFSATKSDGKLLPPRRARKPRSRRIVLDHFELCKLKNIVDSYYTKKQEVPTLSKILAAAQSEINFQGGRTTLRTILAKDLGFKFGRHNKELLIPRGSKNIESSSETDGTSDSDDSEQAISGTEDQKPVIKKIKFSNETDNPPISGVEDQKVFAEAITFSNNTDNSPNSGATDQKVFRIVHTVPCKEEPISRAENEEALVQEIKLEVE